MTPGYIEFVDRLKESVSYCDEADDVGSIHHEMARWQEWVKTWEPIYDENGGL